MKQKHWKVSVFNKTSETVRDDAFYTTDTEAYLVFELTDEDFKPDSAMVTVYNIYGKAIINARAKVEDGIVQYRMPVGAIGHPGGWRTQVIFTEDNEDDTTKIIEFDVDGHLLDDKKPTFVEIENWNSFIKHAEGLVGDWERLEEIRQTNEQQRELAESARQTEFETNETSRQTNESAREKAENNRQSTFETNESARQNEFETNENERESTFEINESARQANELIREEAEGNRQSTFEENEQARESAESVRVSNEEERISKDSERDSKIEKAIDSIDELKNNVGSLITSVEVTNTKWGSEEVDIDITTGTIDIANHGLTNGDIIAMISFERDNSIVPGVKEGFPYYVVNSKTNTFQLSELKDGLPISIEFAGTSPYWQIEKLGTTSIYITGLDLKKCKVLIHGAGTVSNNNNRFHDLTIPDFRYFHYASVPNIYDGYNNGSLVNARATRHFFTNLNLYTDRYSTYLNYQTDVLFLTNEIPSTSVKKEYSNNTYTLPRYGYNKITTVGVYHTSSYLFDGTTLEVYSLE